MLNFGSVVKRLQHPTFERERMDALPDAAVRLRRKRALVRHDEARVMIRGVPDRPAAGLPYFVAALLLVTFCFLPIRYFKFQFNLLITKQPSAAG